jgi:predicted site-specific integrase-resolvase
MQGQTNQRWVTMNQACELLGISLSTLKRRISKGEFESKLEGQRRVILIPGEVQVSQDENPSVLIEQLQKENDDLSRQIADLQNDKQHLQEQWQNQNERIERLEQLLAMEKQQNQQLVDYQLQPFWKKWFGKQKALPAPGDVMDMETDKES